MGILQETLKGYGVAVSRASGNLAEGGLIRYGAESHGYTPPEQYHLTVAAQIKTVVARYKKLPWEVYNNMSLLQEKDK